MIVETTVNLQKDVVARLKGASAAAGRSRSWLIMTAMKRLAKRHGTMIRDAGCVMYQDDAEATTWRRQHVSVWGRDYELFLDMRKIFKRSVSLLVSIAIISFLDLIVAGILAGEYDEDTDNYPLQCYAIVQELIENVICWRIYWGIPEKPGKILTSTA